MLKLNHVYDYRFHISICQQFLNEIQKNKNVSIVVLTMTFAACFLSLSRLFLDMIE